MRRLEIYPKQGQPSIVISRPDKGVIWSLCASDKIYSQAKLPKALERAFNPDTLYEWTETGMSTIDGRKHKTFVGRYQATEAPIGKAKEICFVDANTGMRRRIESYNKQGKLVSTIDYLNAKLGRPPRKAFKLPAGYKRVSLARMLRSA